MNPDRNQYFFISSQRAVIFGSFFFLLVILLGGPGQAADIDFGGGYDSNVYQDALSGGSAYGFTSIGLASGPAGSLRCQLSVGGTKYLSLASADNARLFFKAEAPLALEGMAFKAFAEAQKQPNDLIYEYYLLSGGARFKRDQGDRATLDLEYGLRGYAYPHYDLDAIGHRLDGTLDLDLNEDVRLFLNGSMEGFWFSERYLLDPSGNLTADKRYDIFGEVSIRFLLGGLAFGAYYANNSSNGNYYYIGPYGSAEAGTSPVLIDRYYDLTDKRIEGSTELGGARLQLSYLVRDYAGRLARDSTDHLTAEKQNDKQFLSRLESIIGPLKAEIGYLNNSSNDYLSNYQDHWFKLTLWIPIDNSN